MGRLDSSRRLCGQVDGWMNDLAGSRCIYLGTRKRNQKRASATDRPRVLERVRIARSAGRACAAVGGVGEWRGRGWGRGQCAGERAAGVE